MSILCGTDFSSSAQAAADVAALLAKKWNVPLRLMHCTQDYLAVTDLPVVSPGTKTLTAQLRAEASRLRATGVEVIQLLRDGDAVGELIAAAADQATELIVLGSAGRGLAGRWWLGSVTEDVAESGPVPILVVRDPKPLLSWLRNKDSLGTLCGVEIDGSSDATITWMKKFVDIGGIKVGAVYVRSAGDAAQMREQDPAHDRAVSEKLRAILGGEPVTLHVSAASGHPAGKFLTLAKELHADLLVVGRGHRHTLPRIRPSSFSRRVLIRSETNVLCVPLPKLAVTSIPEIRRVLVSIDPKNADGRILRYAQSLLGSGGHIHLVHVLHEPSSGVNPLIAADVYFDASLTSARAREDADSKLKQLLAASSKVPGIRVTSEVTTHENVPAGICAEATSFDADVICMGCKGHARLASALFGSTVQGVLTRSQKPVFIVPSSPQ